MGKIGLLAAAVALGVAACSWPTDTQTKGVADSGAVLSGTVHTDEDSPPDYWFEYGTTAEYGSSTPHRSSGSFWPYGDVVQDEITGLHEGTTYHYRLCTKGAGAGSCSGDLTLGTTSGQDSVIGDGVVTPPIAPDFIRRKVTVDAHQVDAPVGTGQPKATGTAAEGESSQHAPDTGAVTCLRVDGNRATIGFLAQSAYALPGTDPGQPRLIFIEDNGATGDRFGSRDVTDATSCPAATDADFEDIETNGELFPPIVSMGNFVVHDHT